jgi:three-Cys-motif partner protein
VEAIVKEHQFGGSWTSAKLNKINDYLKHYLIALKDQSFQKIYIDAFAGTGYRMRRDSGIGDELPFDENDLEEMDTFIDGSARIALKFDPGFDKYIFIENDPEKCIELDRLKTDFPKKSESIQVWKEDSNKALADFCGDKTIWKTQRAVLFLDPYGLQVNWDTIECIAATEAIDLWYLFPVGTVFRLMKKESTPSPANSSRLDSLFGTHDWFDIFYSRHKAVGLFEDGIDFTRDADTIAVSDFLVKRLESIFPGVSKKPAILRNTKRNSPMFLLCFAVANPKDRARNLALRMADHILREEHV